MNDNYIDSVKLNKYNEHIEKLENLLKSVNLTGDYESFRLTPCLMLFNFIDLLRSVAVLDNSHIAVAGEIIIRSMFEILIDFLYCETDRGNLYIRFVEYQNVKRVLLYEISTNDIKEKINKNDYEEITSKKYNEFKDKYKIKNRNELYYWSGLSISKMVDKVKEVEPEVSDLFLNIYKVNCNYVHTNADLICSYCSISDKQLNLEYDKNYKKDKYILIQKINSLVDIFYKYFNNIYANKDLINIKF